MPGAGPFGDANDKNGIYRLGRDGVFTLVADIGNWSVDNPPVPAFFVDTGVQYAMERYNGGFLVTDGHHNRVLWVKRNGSIKEVATFGNVVPTGLEVTKHRVFITQLGPIPHEPEDGKVLALHRRSSPTEIASGASMLIDVERGPHGKLYALSQGQWDGVGEGSPAKPDTGRLVIDKRDGSLKPVVDHFCDVDLENGVRNPVGSSRHDDSSRHGDLAGFPGGTDSCNDGHGRNRNAVESEFDFIGGVCLDMKR